MARNHPRNADTLLNRVSELLNVSDTEMHLDLQPADISTLTHRTVDQFTVAAERAGVSLTTEIPREVIAEVDENRLAQAVENLISNALKFTARGGRVAVAVRSISDSICIAVSDTGIGMTPDEQSRVFDRFYRAKSVRENAVQRIGVGLSLVKTVIDAHGGDITIRSAPQEGSTIELHLPLRTLQTTTDAAAQHFTS